MATTHGNTAEELEKKIIRLLDEKEASLKEKLDSFQKEAKDQLNEAKASLEKKLVSFDLEAKKFLQRTQESLASLEAKEASLKEKIDSFKKEAKDQLDETKASFKKKEVSFDLEATKLLQRNKESLASLEPKVKLLEKGIEEKAKREKETQALLQVAKRKATRHHLFDKLKYEAKLISSTSFRPWDSSLPDPLIEQPGQETLTEQQLPSGQETTIYYATEYQLVFLESLEAMRKELVTEEIELMKIYDEDWWIKNFAVYAGILGACGVFAAFILNPWTLSFIYSLLATAFVIGLGVGVYANFKKHKMFQWLRDQILESRKELDKVASSFEKELTKDNAQRLRKDNHVTLVDASTRVHRLKASLMGGFEASQRVHCFYMFMSFMAALLYLVAITCWVFLPNSREVPTYYCHYPSSNYEYLPPPPANYWSDPPTPPECRSDPLPPPAPNCPSDLPPAPNCPSDPPTPNS